jgi:hypothetical protein
MNKNKFLLLLLILISCVSCKNTDTDYNLFYFRSSIHYFLAESSEKTLWIKKYDSENDDYLNYKTNDDLLKLIKNASYSEIENVNADEKSTYYLFFGSDIPENVTNYKYYIYPNNVISVYHYEFVDGIIYTKDYEVERYYNIDADDYTKIVNLLKELLEYCRCCES